MGIEFDIGAAVLGMGVAASRVCLPNLDEAVDDRRAPVVPDIADDFDALAGSALASVPRFGDAVMVAGLNQIGTRTERGIGGQIGTAFPGQAEVKEGPGGLPGRLTCHAHCSMGVALRPRSTKSKR